MPPSEHGLMSPSSLFRRMICPGSHYAEVDLPEPPASEDANEGTKLHELIAAYGNKKITEQEMMEKAGDSRHMLSFCMDVEGAVKALHPNAHVWHEHKMDHSSIHPAVGTGTADFIVVNPWKTGSIIDWKFGHGDVPPARFNLQLAAYAVAAAREFELESVYVAVVMAARGYVSEHTYKPEELERVKVKIHGICEAALIPWAPRRVLIETCQYCKAFAICPDVLAVAKRAKQLSEDQIPEQITGESLGKLLSETEILGTWVNRLKAQATRLMLAGGEVQGWCMRPGRELRHWADGVTPAQLQEVVRSLGKDADKVLRVEMISPAQLDDVVGRSKKVKAALEPLTVKRAGDLRLAKAGTTEE